MLDWTKETGEGSTAVRSRHQFSYEKLEKMNESEDCDYLTAGSAAPAKSCGAC